jgi:hypothetical protein
MIGKRKRRTEEAMLAAKDKKPTTAMKKGRYGSVSSASKRADGIAKKGKTRGKMV